MMITAVVFSKDRACQLDLLLTSLERNGRGLFHPVVLYRATNEEHEKAYSVCRERFWKVPFQPDGDAPVRVAAELFGLASYGCFFTDDSVLYRSIPFPPTQLSGRVLCFSLRLGLNTTWCYPYDREQITPTARSVILQWDWTTADGDFGYPASVDGHVFSGLDLYGALAGCAENANPNQMEEHLVKTFALDARVRMASYPHSCLVGIPANIVTDTHRNRHAHGPTPDDLCASYLSGKRLDLDAMDFTDVRGAHQDIELVLA